MIEKSHTPPAPDDRDEVLILRIAEGDRAAFDIFARRHGEFLFAVSVRMIRDRFEAQDVVQEILMRVWQKAGLWRPEAGAAVRTWMYRIAHNSCIDYMRRKKPYTALPASLTARETADAATLQSSDRQRLDRAMRELPEKQRAMLILCHHEGFKIAEAAAIIGITDKAGESALQRARKLMRAKLETLHEE